MALIKTVNDLGSRIRARRKAIGWDQARLAREVGVSRQWVIDIEKGKARAELGLALRTLNALGLSLETRETDPAAKSLPSPSRRTPSANASLIDAIIEQRAGTDLERIAREMDTASTLASKFLEETDLQRIAREMNTASTLASKFLEETDLQRIAREMNTASNLASKYLEETDLQRIARESDSLTDPVKRKRG